MMLGELNKIAKLGAQKPLIFWLSEYNRLQPKILSGLDDLLAQLHQTVAQKKIQALKDVFSQEKPEEFLLASTLLALSEIIQKKKSADDQIVIEKSFLQNSKEFYRLAKLNLAFTKKRIKLQKTLEAEEQIQYNLRLFQYEGDMYCLEYYLYLYKKIIDSTKEEDKKSFFEALEVTMESGKIPGLWADFNNLDVLEKFIYLILNDDVREKLVATYFATREKVLKIKNQEVFDYQECSLEEAVENLKKLILVFFQVFQSLGLKKLKSHFLTPYGYQPKISEIKL